MTARRALTAAGAAALTVVATSAAFAEAGEQQAEHLGTWLNFLRVHGHPLTSPQQAFSFSVLLIIVLSLAAIAGGRRFRVQPGPGQVVLETALGAIRNELSAVEREVGGVPHGRDNSCN